MNTVTVDFNGHELLVVEEDGIKWVAVKPIVDAIGMSWTTQYDKLRRNWDKFNCSLMRMVAKNNKDYKMLCIPLEKVQGFLFSVNPKRIKILSTRRKLELFQQECFQYLHDVWTKGVAVNPRLHGTEPGLIVVDDITPTPAAAPDSSLAMMQLMLDEMVKQSQQIQSVSTRTTLHNRQAN